MATKIYRKNSFSYFLFPSVYDWSNIIIMNNGIKDIRVQWDGKGWLKLNSYGRSWIIYSQPRVIKKVLSLSLEHFSRNEGAWIAIVSVDTNTYECYNI